MNQQQNGGKIEHIRTKTEARGSGSVSIQINCSTAAQVDACWRMLCYVPDREFEPVVLALNGEPIYRIIRENGDQTAAPLSVQPGHTFLL